MIRKDDYFNDNGIMQHKLAMEESARCLLCENAPCTIASPDQLDTAKFIRSLRFKNCKGAAETVREGNPLAGCCAYLAVLNNPSESGCSRKKIDQAIHIALLQQYVVNQEINYGMDILAVGDKNNKKTIACIGSGPTSLTVASQLAQQGFAVTVLDQADKIGGSLLQHTCSGRIPESIFLYEMNLIEKLGVVFKTNVTFKDSYSLKKLQNTFDAVFIGCELIEDHHVSTSLSVTDFFTQYTKNPVLSEKQLVIVGQTDDALDAALYAKAQGAKVKLITSDNLENINQRKYEMIVLKEKIPFLTGFHFQKQVRNGNQQLEKKYIFCSDDEQSSSTFTANEVVFAGEKQINHFLRDNFTITENGLVKVNKLGMTSLQNVFSAGENVEGLLTVSQQVGAGKKSAMKIAQYLRERNEDL
jgi:dihydropyrimidine dehydrogenase (NAD+) subunit PreT